MTSGRLKKTLDDLPEGWQEKAFELALQGASDVELRVMLGISNDLFYRFLDEEPIFSETIKKCHDLCQVWWEKNGRLNLDTKEFNSTLWYMNMKNRFGWADKQEVRQDVKSEIKATIDPGKLTDEQLRVVAEIQRKSGVSQT